MDERVTVEGLAGLQVITDGATGQQFEDLQGYMLLLEHDDDVIDSMLELRAEWTLSSSSPLSLAMDKQVAETLNLPLKSYETNIVADLSDVQKQAINAIFDVTQRILSHRGISHLVVYRGLCWNELPEWMDESLEVGHTLKLEDMRILSSWSLDQNIAYNFATNKHFGVVIKAEMPIKRVFAIITILDEAESVCITQDQDDVYEIISIYRRGTE